MSDKEVWLILFQSLLSREPTDESFKDSATTQIDDAAALADYALGEWESRWGDEQTTH
jgi:hypothetical protein